MSPPGRPKGEFLSAQREGSPVRPGRNDPCPCGSQRKYKHCCGACAPAVPAAGAAATLEAALAVLRQGDHAAAERLVRDVLERDPASADAQQLLGAVLLERGRHGEALPWLERALVAQPHFGTHYNLGLARHAVGSLEAAVAAFRAALALRPGGVDALNNLGTCLLDLGFPAEGAEALRQAVAQPDASPSVFSNLLLALQYLPKHSLDESLQLHRRCGERIESAASPLPSRPPLAHGGALRVGLVSGDLRTHPVGLLLAGLLPELARAGLQCWVYSSRAGRAGDPLPDQLRGQVAAWRDIVALDDAAVARQVQADQIDVLVDLSGHTSHNRLGVFALRPAPLQVSWLGYGATTGLTRIDAVLGDPWSTPAGDETQFVERLVRLPVPRLPFTPPANAPAPGEPPCLGQGHVTFGCFNNIAKVSPAVVGLWASILHAVPDACLFFKGRQFDHLAPRQALTAAFEGQGIEAARLRFEGFDERREYLRAFAQVDIALDPFPFTGGMSTLDALWMGVPVVSMRGDRMIARQGEMILTPLALQDWLADGAVAYRQRAVAAAADHAALAQLRGQLRQRVAASPAADLPGYAAALARTLRGLLAQRYGAA